MISGDRKVERDISENISLFFYNLHMGSFGVLVSI